MIRAFLVFSCVAVARVATASLPAIPFEDKFNFLSKGGGDKGAEGEGGEDKGASNSMGAEFGFGQLNEDFYLQTTIKTELNFGKLGLGLNVPINILAYDVDPENRKETYYGLVRKEDWDEPGEFVRVIKHLRLGQKRDPFFLQVGNLAAELGHGTIVSRYMNNTELDTFHLGLQFDVNSNYGGFETLVSDAKNLLRKKDARLVGVRVYLKPYGILVDPEGALNIFSIGATVASDLDAPVELEYNDAGALVLDKHDRPNVTKSENASVWGIDAEIELLHSSMLDLVPYADMNFVHGGSWGMHVGVLATAKLPILFDIKAPLRIEYRRFNPGYVPAYFSGSYDLERYQFPLNAQNPRTKKKAMSDAGDGDGVNGFYGDLAADFAGLVRIGALYEDYEKADANLSVYASVPALEAVKLKAYYSRVAIEGLKDIIAFDERSTLVADGRYELIPFVFLAAQFVRSWKFNPETGKPDTVDQWNFGVDLNFDF